MNFFAIITMSSLFFVQFGAGADDASCTACTDVVGAMQYDHQIANLAEISDGFLDEYVKNHVEDKCTGTYCARLIQQIHEQIDYIDNDEIPATPRENCQVMQFCD